MKTLETTVLRLPRTERALVPDLELRVICRTRGGRYVRGVEIREWWLPPEKENAITTSRGIVIRAGELDAVIAALTEAKNLMACVRSPWQAPSCPSCQSSEAQQARRISANNGSLPADYYCDLCGAVNGPLRRERPTIDLANNDDNRRPYRPRRHHRK